jgi:antirestriction protein
MGTYSMCKIHKIYNIFLCILWVHILLAKLYVPIYNITNNKTLLIFKEVIIMMNIYLTNLGKYNEGQLIGEWVELPVSKEELQKVFERIGINEEYEEYFITDYECDFYEVGEYENIDTLNGIAERIEELDEEESKIVKALMSDLGYTLDEAIEKVNSGDYRIYSDCDSMTDIAYQVVEECGYLNNVPDTVARYFDYEAFGRDLGIEGTFIFLDDGSCLEVIR